MVLVLLLVLIVLTLPIYAAPETGKAPQLSMPDALVWISSPNTAATYISVTFPKAISDTQAQMLLANILKETGWTANNINITTDKPSESNGNPMTSIEFMPIQSAIYPDGTLPVEPLVKALKEMKSIQILVMTPPGFKYAGVNNFENRYIKLTLTTGQNTYNFNINVKDSNFQDPGFPKTNVTTPTEPTKSGVGWGIITLIIIIALLVAAMVFYKMNKQIKKQ